MDLILWRHCDAEPGVPDDLRRLTRKGVDEAARMAQWLSPRLRDTCRVIVSPAVRAQQTAQALGRAFRTVPALAPGACVTDVLDAANWPGARDPVLVVGHQPALGLTAAQLLGDEPERPLRAGGVIWLSQDRRDGRVLLQVAMDPRSA
jgi:phosphohistidine phosphatase